MRRSVAVGLLATSILVWPGAASAGPGERLRPSASPNAHLTTESSQVVPAWTPSANLVVAYERAVSQSRDPDRLALHQQLGAHVLAGFGIAGWAELALGLPLVIFQQGRGPDGREIVSVPTYGVGDLRIGLKGTILRTPRRGFGLGLSFDVTAPTGDRTALTGWGAPTYAPQILLDRRMRGGVLWSFNLGYWARPDAYLGGTVLGDAVTYRTALDIPISTRDQISAVAEVDGHVATLRGGRHPVAVRAGFRWRLRSGVVMGLMAGGNAINEFGPASVEGLFTFAYASPKQLHTERAFEKQGRPSAVDWARRDDRVHDRQDGDPAAAKAVDPADLDRDGLLADADRCPSVAEDLDGFEDGDGCPELDNDRDGLRDDMDLCPEAPELVNGYLDADGCPDRRLADGGETYPSFDPRLVAPVLEFPAGQAELTAAQRDELAALAELMRLNPWMQFVHLTPFVEPTASPKTDRALASARADAIRSFLLAQGVEPSRIRAGEARALPEGVAPKVRLSLSTPAGGLAPLAPPNDGLAERWSAPMPASPAAPPKPARGPELEAQGPSSTPR